MKVILILSFAIMILVSCNSDNNRPKETSEKLKELELTAERNALRSITSVTVKPDNTYVDLKTNQIIKIRMDTITRNIYDVKTNYPIDYVIDPSTNDTFDRKGRIINRAITLGIDGTWVIDESKLNRKDSQR